MPRTILTVAMLVALAATEARAARPMPASGELTCGSPHLGECDYYDPATNLLVIWQRDWPVRRLKLVTEAGPSAEARQQDATRWIALVYQPDDDAEPEAPLFQVAVLPRSDWIRQSMKSSLAAGVEVATDGQLVAIASLQAANPYPPGSRDADIFDALLPRIEEISRLVQFAEPTSSPSSSRRGRGQPVVNAQNR